MSLQPRLAAYIAKQMPQARDVAVSALSRISGGASRETYRFLLNWTDETGDVLFEFIDTTVCFRTGRIVHVVSDTWVNGTEDVATTIRAAYDLLDHVNDAYAGTTPEDEEDDG